MTRIAVVEVDPGRKDVPICITEDYEVESNFIKFYSGVKHEMTPELMHEIYAE